MKKLLSIITIITVVTLLSSCNKTDLTASYIYIDTTAFSLDCSNYNTIHGTNYDADELASICSHNFSDAWIFVNGQDLGTWELPCRIPILCQDSAQVLIYPGVKMNGSSTSRPQYPFIDPYKTTIPLVPSTVDTLTSLPLTYTSVAKFEYIENFNTDYNGIFHATTSDGANFAHIADPGNPTNRIGEISLEDSIIEFEIISREMEFNNVLPKYAFLEMDYKSDIENSQIYVGIRVEKTTTAATTYEPLVVVNTKSQWKKIYINLTQAITRNQMYAKSYRVQISGGRPDDTEAHYYFDNIKVIYQ